MANFAVRLVHGLALSAIAWFAVFAAACVTAH